MQRLDCLYVLERSMRHFFIKAEMLKGTGEKQNIGPTLPLMKNTERCEVVADAATDIKVRLFDRVTEIQPFLEALPPAKYV
jgi:hypothetical protein